MALICREFGWTYAEYREQPQWFITIVFSMLQNQAEEARRNAKS